jgi:hypothetical protein
MFKWSPRGGRKRQHLSNNNNRCQVATSNKSCVKWLTEIKQITPLVEEWKGCVCINAIKENPNGRYSNDLLPKSKPRSMGGEEAKGEIKQLGEPYERTWKAL